jgi:phytoene synthase
MDMPAHAADIVRAADRDRYLADLFAPAAARPHLFALHAFDAEIARIRDSVREPALGEIRLQWWRDAIHGDAAGHPVATALNQTVAAFSLPLAALDNLIEARRFDLYDDAMPSLNQLEGYAGETGSAMMQLGAIVLAGGRDPGTGALSGHAGVAHALTGLLAALPRHSARRQCYLPAELMAAHGVDPADLLAGRSTPALLALLGEMRAIVRRHLDAARQLAASLAPGLLPAYLPLAPVELRLRAMEKPGFDPLRMASAITPWRRHWLIWRAARRGVW